jgi:hypothetical protein
MGNSTVGPEYHASARQHHRAGRYEDHHDVPCATVVDRLSGVSSDEAFH